MENLKTGEVICFIPAGRKSLTAIAAGYRWSYSDIKTKLLLMLYQSHQHTLIDFSQILIFFFPGKV